MHVCPSENCPLVINAQQSAHDAIETSGAAVAMSAQAKSDVEQIKNSLKWQTVLQLSVVSVVALCTAYIGYLAATQKQTLVAEAVSATENMVDSRLRQHLESTRQSNLDTAREAIRLERQERELAANPQPIAKTPDKLAARGNPH
jgi:hypothetical protein